MVKKQKKKKKRPTTQVLTNGMKIGGTCQRKYAIKCKKLVSEILLWFELEKVPRVLLLQVDNQQLCELISRSEDLILICTKFSSLDKTLLKDLHEI